jgi:RND family efflux transporter MFP subunit
MKPDREAPRPRTPTVSARRSARLAASLLAVPLLAAVAVGGGCDRSTPGAGQQQQQAGGAPPVSVFKAVQREVSEWDVYPGRLEAIDAVEVRARVSGFIEEAPFDEGVIVEKGTPLFVLDARPYQADLDRAQAEVARTESQRKYAQSELERINALQPSGAASGREQLNARQAQETADAAVASAKAAVESARLNLEFTKVVAPIKGRVGRKLVTRGNLVNGGTGQTTLLTTITSLDPIYCSFDVDEGTVRRYQRMAQEQKRPSARDVKLPTELAIGNEPEFAYRGTLDFIDNRIQPGTGTINVRAIIPNPRLDLLPGFYARARVPGRSAYPATLIPPVAVGSTLAEQFVLVVGPDGVVQQKPVTLGEVFDGLQAVEGIKPGDLVIVSGLVTARAGVKVTPQEVPAERYMSRPGPATRPGAATRPAAMPEPAAAPASPATAPATQAASAEVGRTAPALGAPSTGGASL